MMFGVRTYITYENVYWPKVDEKSMAAREIAFAAIFII